MRRDLKSFVKHRSDEENCQRQGFAYSKYVVCICSRIKCTLVSAMHVILLLPHVFRVRGRPVKLHRCGRKTYTFVRMLCCDINFALFIMNIQCLISSNQLSNAFCDFLCLSILSLRSCISYFKLKCDIYITCVRIVSAIVTITIMLRNRPWSVIAKLFLSCYFPAYLYAELFFL